MHEVVIVSIVFLTTFGIVYLGVSSWHKQNMAMIEAGMMPIKEKRKEKKHNNLRGALLLICVPLGILVGNIVYTWVNMDSDTAALVFAFLFGGIALTATYFIEDSQKNSKEEE